MNIFFYAASVSKYSKQYFKALQSSIAVKKLILLPSGRGLISSAALSLRSGDILILYAASDNGIENLLAMESDLKGFRVLLLLSRECSREYRDRAYQLSPVFVAEPIDFTELSAVVMNILFRNDAEIQASSHS